MEPKVIKTAAYSFVEDSGSVWMKTQYFPDGSAIIVTEKSIHLVERIARYEVIREQKPE